MKKFLCVTTAILCCVCTLVLFACKPAATEQQVADKQVEASTAALADYTFAKAAADSALVAAREGDADMYIVAHSEGGDKLIYVYQDVYYDTVPVTDTGYRYVDVYMPTAKEKLAADTPVFLYLHGGGWVAGSRKDEQLSLMPYIASTGMVVVSMEYGLWFGLNQMQGTDKGVYGWESFGLTNILDTVLRNEHPVSVKDMMADVTACITFLRDTYLPSLGLTATKIGIGGYSAGGHLSSLYAYKYAEQSPIELAYLMDLVGPVKLLDETYLRILNRFLGRTPVADGEEEDEAATNLKRMIRPLLSDLAPALAGILGETVTVAEGETHPYDISTEQGYQNAMAAIPNYQSIDYLTSSSVPTIICYAGSHDDIPIAEALFGADTVFDDFIPKTIYDAISSKLDEVGIVHSDIFYDNLTHNNIGKDSASTKWMAAHVRAYAELYCK